MEIEITLSTSVALQVTLALAFPVVLPSFQFAINIAAIGLLQLMGVALAAWHGDKGAESALIAVLIAIVVVMCFWQ